MGESSQEQRGLRSQYSSKMYKRRENADPQGYKRKKTAFGKVFEGVDEEDPDYISIESDVKNQLDAQLHPLRYKKMHEIFPVLKYFENDKREREVEDDELSPGGRRSSPNPDDP